MLAVVLIAMFLGVDPSALLEGGAGEPVGEVGVPDGEGGQFAAVVLRDTEDTWNRLFSERGA